MLVKMWRTVNSHILPLGRQNSTATLEKQFGSFLKGKQTLI